MPLDLHFRETIEDKYCSHCLFIWNAFTAVIPLTNTAASFHLWRGQPHMCCVTRQWQSDCHSVLLFRAIEWGNDSDKISKKPFKKKKGKKTLCEMASGYCVHTLIERNVLCWHYFTRLFIFGFCFNFVWFCSFLLTKTQLWERH